MSQIHDEPANETLPAAIRWRLDELKRRAGEPALREFAVWCATQVASGHYSVMQTVALFRAAGRDDSGEKARLLQRYITSGAWAASTIGMKVNPAAASAQLSAIQGARPGAYEAAVQASKHVRDFFAFSALKDPDALSVTGRPALEAAACALGCQIDQLDRMVAACEPPKADYDSGPTKGER